MDANTQMPYLKWLHISMTNRIAYSTILKEGGEQDFPVCLQRNEKAQLQVKQGLFVVGSFLI